MRDSPCRSASLKNAFYIYACGGGFFFFSFKCLCFRACFFRCKFHSRYARARVRLGPGQVRGHGAVPFVRGFRRRSVWKTRDFANVRARQKRKTSTTTGFPNATPGVSSKPKETPKRNYTVDDSITLEIRPTRRRVVSLS